MNYYLRKGSGYMAGKPLSLEDVKAMLRLGKIDSSWQVRTENDEVWKDVSSLLEASTQKQFDPSPRGVDRSLGESPQMIELLQNVIGNQQEQLRQLRAIRWVLVGIGLLLALKGFLF